ncbi:acetyl xylan esterase [Enterobacter hormaechei]|nr:acetyl xylan esterase [Enterobacter hormaechei]MBE8834719.1 acetyl xylan esterase [Enterobacter hormaechei]MBE8960615.1 acetyl xylan esterase [Enterobacter hormaechei]QFI32823.1 acetyl xylan esterase [Enterobacter hormaechei]TBV83978.1 acetyl xylan esterase [Enterobacter hormaechei]
MDAPTTPAQQAQEWPSGLPIVVLTMNFVSVNRMQIHASYACMDF